MFYCLVMAIGFKQSEITGEVKSDSVCLNNFFILRLNNL